MIPFGKKVMESMMALAEREVGDAVPIALIFAGHPPQSQEDAEAERVKINVSDLSVLWADGVSDVTDKANIMSVVASNYINQLTEKAVNKVEGEPTA